MIHVLVKKQVSYPVSATKIKRALTSFLVSHGIVSNANVEVAIVGEKEMAHLGQKHLKEKPGDPLHSVLSFPESETDSGFVYPPDNPIINLGEIIICFPVVQKEAGKSGKLTEDLVVELVEHGALHLLGIHHE